MKAQGRIPEYEQDGYIIFSSTTLLTTGSMRAEVCLCHLPPPGKNKGCRAPGASHPGHRLLGPVAGGVPSCSSAREGPHAFGFGCASSHPQSGGMLRASAAWGAETQTPGHIWCHQTAKVHVWGTGPSADTQT